MIIIMNINIHEVHCIMTESEVPVVQILKSIEPPSKMGKFSDGIPSYQK